jgi:hypothetical protein
LPLPPEWLGGLRERSEEEAMEEIVIKVAPGQVRVKGGRCPNGCDLMDETVPLSGVPSIRVDVHVGGRRAPLNLNALYGVFEYRCALSLESGQIVEVFCPKCEASLIDPESLCSMCKIPMFSIRLPDGGQVAACPKVGCHNHKLVIVDLDAQLGQLYDREKKLIL